MLSQSLNKQSDTDQGNIRSGGIGGSKPLGGDFRDCYLCILALCIRDSTSRTIINSGILGMGHRI